MDLQKNEINLAAAQTEGHWCPNHEGVELKEEPAFVRVLIKTRRQEMKEMELRLQGEIEQVRLEIEQVRKEISETKASLVKWMFLFWTGQIIAFAGLLKLLLA